jgi:toxin ParE1/3/4
MAEYKLSRLAQADLEEITEYTALNFGERQAVVYSDQIHSAAQTAASFPSFGLPYTTKAGRVFQKYNSGRHAVFYQPNEQGIFIVRVLHSMMDFDQYL